MSMSAARSTAISLALASSGLVACSASHPISKAVTTYARGMPPGVKVFHLMTAAPKPIVAREGTDKVYVTTWGSGSCPELPTQVRAEGPHRLVVKTRQHLPKGATVCTADLGPTTSTIQLPSKIDIAAPITVEVNGTVLTLDPS